MNFRSNINFNLSALRMVGLTISCLFFYCCTSSDENTAIELEYLLQEGNNVRLIFENDDRLFEYVSIIEALSNEANSAVQHVMPIDDVVIRVLVNEDLTIPQFGFAGYNPTPNEIAVYLSDTFAGLAASLEAELPAILAHEMHHAKRQRSIGYGNTLFQAIISEGLADHFSLEAIGSNPSPWSTAVSGAELQELTDLASQDWNSTPYDFEKWFFGTTTEIPVWTGYSIGYDLVDKFLTENPTLKPSTLYDEPAASFSP